MAMPGKGAVRRRHSRTGGDQNGPGKELGLRRATLYDNRATLQASRAALTAVDEDLNSARRREQQR